MSCRIELNDMRHLVTDGVDAVQVEFQTGFVGNSRQVKHRIGRAAQSHVGAQAIVNGFVRHDIAGTDVVLD